MFRRGFFVLLAFVLLGVGATTADDQDRTYHVYVPSSYDESVPTPLVIALHPFASSGKAMQAITGFDAAADDYGFIVAYPNTLDFRWEDGRALSQDDDPDTEPIDDTGFLRSMLDELSAAYTLDTDRIFVAGFANGGTMAYRLACELPVAKVATVGATLRDYHLDVCAQADNPEPVSVLSIMGTADAIYPVDGEQAGPDGIRSHSLEATVGFWAEQNACAADSIRKPNDSFTLYDDCAGDVQVAAYTVDQAAHAWLRTGDYTLNRFGIDYTDIIARFFLDADWVEEVATLQAESELDGGYSRSYVLYVPPSYDPAEPMPLVMALHGRPHNGYGVAYLLDLNQTAAEQGFIVVYPDGIDEEWNYPQGIPAYPPIEIDDVAFLRAVIDDLAVDLNLDHQRLYVTGFSNGGFMTQRMACSASDEFAAFAVIGASLENGFIDYCMETPPVPILFMHGTEDESVPWQGIAGERMMLLLSVPDSVMYWASHNGCSADNFEVTDFEPQGPTTEVSLFSFQDCLAGSQVDFYWIDGGGHTIPGVPGRMDPTFFGEVNLDIRAPDVIWEFFQQFTLADE